MASEIDVDSILREARQSMKNFDLNAIIRGVQLTVVGGTFLNYVVQNMGFTHTSFASSSKPRAFQGGALSTSSSGGLCRDCHTPVDCCSGNDHLYYPKRLPLKSFFLPRLLLLKSYSGCYLL